jgi:hypothetical protein
MLIDGATVDLERENRRLRAELDAQTQALRGSRARLLAAADAERRRLEIPARSRGRRFLRCA